jgi:hypothetical protein
VLGSVELLIGLLTLVGVALRGLGLLGARLAFITSFITILFLITTPDAWVPALGDAQHGFPYLSGGGRLVMKDVLLLAGAWLIMTATVPSLYLQFIRRAPLIWNVSGILLDYGDCERCSTSFQLKQHLRSQHRPPRHDRDFAEYHVLVNADVQNIRVTFVDEPAEIINMHGTMAWAQLRPRRSGTDIAKAITQPATSP